MNTSLLILLFAITMVCLAVIPWAHRAWVTRKSSRVDSGVNEPPKAGQLGSPAETLVKPDPAPSEKVQTSSPSFRDRISKARGLISDRLGAIRGTSISESTWEEVEELLISADVGISATTDAVDRLRVTASEEKLADGTELIRALKTQMKGDLDNDRKLLTKSSAETIPVWLFVGVNGVGKTTSIGKVAQRLADEGSMVLMAAGDTFRAAATEQLEQWAQRTGADLVRGSDGADPSSVIYDAAEAAFARGADIVLADTAGRLQNKINLMEELAKVRRVADKNPGNVVEVLLVIDATTGQNGLSQAKQFTEAVGVTGVVLTKLDGSAKGGIVFAVEHELGLPVKLVGLGEEAGDLVDFDPELFVDALFGDD